MRKLNGDCVVYLNEKRFEPNCWLRVPDDITAAEVKKLESHGFTFDTIEKDDEAEAPKAKKTKAKKSEPILDDDNRAPVKKQAAGPVASAKVKESADLIDEDDDDDDGKAPAPSAGLDIVARAKAAIAAGDYHAGVQVVADAGEKPAKGKTALFAQLAELAE